MYTLLLHGLSGPRTTSRCSVDTPFNRYPRRALPLLVVLLAAAPLRDWAENPNDNYTRWAEEDRKQAREWMAREGAAGAVGTTDEGSSKEAGERWLSSAAVAPETNRPASWAQPMPLDGVENFHKVSEILYRGSQPTAEGMRNLRALGVRTIVSLRAFHSDRDEIGDVDLGYERIPMKAWNLQRKHVLEFLKIVSNPKATPVMVHCLRGSDRTGAMCAAYRIVIQGWSKDEAVREMLKGGYEYHPAWGGIPERLLDFDVEALRKEAGIPAPASPVVQESAPE